MWVFKISYTLRGMEERDGGCNINFVVPSFVIMLKVVTVGSSFMVSIPHEFVII